jgi:hypothetical protein
MPRMIRNVLVGQVIRSPLSSPALAPTRFHAGFPAGAAIRVSTLRFVVA